MNSLSKFFTVFVLILFFTACGTQEKIDVKTQSGASQSSRGPASLSQKQSNTNVPLALNNEEKKNQNSSDKVPVSPELVSTEPVPKKANTNKLRIVSCEQGKTDEWSGLMEKFYPTFPVRFVGQVCTLSNSHLLVTMALQKAHAVPSAEAYKKVILFDKNKKHILSTTGLTCANLGDITPPSIDEKTALRGETLVVTCGGGDAGYMFSDEIEIQLHDFSFRTIRETSVEPDEEKGSESPEYIQTVRILQKDGSWKVTTTPYVWY